ncbi:hypothetical protein [Paenibacillus aquistagni]|nr:hypothetical protein [Paenibacillus aquistagni]NMM54392.1 hypothetical protein [Paenibacillus aquistagni]
MGVPTWIWIASAVIVVLIAWPTFWITNKAYSRKWEQDDDDRITER